MAKTYVCEECGRRFTPHWVVWQKEGSRRYICPKCHRKLERYNKKLDRMKHKAYVNERRASKIIIDVPSDAFAAYDTIKNNEYTYNIFFSILAIPALQYFLQKIQLDMLVNSSTLDDETIDYPWIESVKKAYMKNNDAELDDKTFAGLDVEVLAQELLNNGTSKALDDVFGLVTAQPMEALVDD